MQVSLPPRHRLLLRAAIGEGWAAAEAFAAWCRERPLSAADVEESSVLPLLASRLDSLGDLDATARSRLRGLRRHAVVRQFVVVEELRTAARCLAAAGITPVAIKGIALAAAYGEDRVRAVGDADLLVPEGTRERAVDALLAGGFSPGLGIVRPQLPVWASRFHALPMQRPGSPEVDVHWRLSHQPVWCEGLTGAIVDRAVAQRDEPWLVPHAAHQMAIAVAHGWPAAGEGSLRMLVDLAVLLADPTVTPDLVDEVAGPHRLRHALAAGLATLAAEGVTGAADLRDSFPRPRHSDRLMATVLRDDTSGLPARLAVAAAHHRAGGWRRPPAIAMDRAAPGDPATATGVSLAGEGWWLGDGWGTWSRRRIARLSVAAASAPAHLRFTLAPQPGRGRRWVLVGRGLRWRRVRFRHGAPADMSLALPARRVTVWFVVPRTVVAGDVLGTLDRRRLGVAVTGVSASG